MLNKISKMFASRPKAPLPAVPDGTRYYVIGDIHGRLDLYEALIEAIEEDDAASGAAETQIVLLGDLVDRGPDSAGVVKRTRKWGKKRSVRVLAGNHEDMFLQSFERESVLRHFLKHGGRETILSYGLTKKEFNSLDVPDIFDRLPDLVPQKDRDFIAGFEQMIVAGDYVFVHAGVDPRRPLEKQKRDDMLWIRERFLAHEGPHEKVVVHGHTIFEDVEDNGHRIGIDTGAFRSDVLTALVLEGDGRRYLQTRLKKGRIRVDGVAQQAAMASA